MCNAEAIFALQSDNNMACKADVHLRVSLGCLLHAILANMACNLWVIYLPLADDKVANARDNGAL